MLMQNTLYFSVESKQDVIFLEHLHPKLIPVSISWQLFKNSSKYSQWTNYVGVERERT